MVTPLIVSVVTPPPTKPLITPLTVPEVNAVDVPAPEGATCPASPLVSRTGAIATSVYDPLTTPLMVNGVLYSTAGTRRAVVALDAATGEQLWMHSENEGPRGVNAPRQLSGRGLAYWSDGKDERIFYVTPGYRLICVDAKTGMRVVSFANKGEIDLKMNDDQEILPDLTTGEIGIQSAPQDQSAWPSRYGNR